MRQHQLINKYLEAAANRYAQLAGSCDTKFSQQVSFSCPTAWEDVFTIIYSVQNNEDIYLI